MDMPKIGKLSDELSFVADPTENPVKITICQRSEDTIEDPQLLSEKVSQKSDLINPTES